MSLAEFLLKGWREEVEKPLSMYRTFGSSRNCSNCYFRNRYNTWSVCRYHIIGIPIPSSDFKCSKWEKK